MATQIEQLRTSFDSSSVSAKSKQKKSSFKWVAVCLVIVLILGGGLFAFSALNNSNGGGIIGTNNSENDNKLIVGTWGTIRDSVGADGIGVSFMTFIFKQDDTYTLIIPQYSIKEGLNPDYINQIGTYEFKGTTLTLKASYDSFGSAQTTEYKIELDDDEMIFVEETQVYDIYHVVNKGEKFIKK